MAGKTELESVDLVCAPTFRVEERRFERINSQANLSSNQVTLTQFGQLSFLRQFGFFNSPASSSPFPALLSSYFSWSIVFFSLTARLSHDAVNLIFPASSSSLSL